MFQERCALETIKKTITLGMTEFDPCSVPNMTSAVAFGRSGRRTSIFKTALDLPSLADFTQLGNVRGLDRGPRVL